jgi:hypothetical protein
MLILSCSSISNPAMIEGQSVHLESHRL